MLAVSSRMWPRLGILGLAAVYYLVPWHAAGPVADWAGPPVAFLLLVVVPGTAVADAFGLRPRDMVETTAWIPLLGLVAALLGCFVWALWGVSADGFRLVYPAVATILGLAATARSRAGDRTRVPPHAGVVTPGSRRGMFALLAFASIVAAIVWVTGPPTHFNADTLDHAAWVDEVAATGEAFPTTAFYKDPGADGADLRKSLLHAFMGAMTRHLGSDPLRLFAFLAGAWLVVLAAVAYTATYRLFGNRAVAVVSAFVFLLAFDGGVGSKVVRTMFYPNRFGMAPLLLFIAAAMTHLARPSRRALAVCAAMGFLAAAVHVQYMVFTAMAAAVIVVWKTCSPCASWRLHLRRSLAAALAAGGAILPYAVYRVVTSYQTNELHSEVQGVMFVGHGLFVAEPAMVWDWMGWLGLATLVAVVPLWRYRRDIPGVGYAMASMLSVIFVVANPLVMPPAFEVLTYLTHRLGRIIPTFMVAGFLLATAMGLERRFPSAPPLRAWRRVATALAFVATAIGAVHVVTNRHVMFGSSAREQRVSLERWADDITAVTAGLPQGSVIASDPVTSYFVTAITPYYVLCTYDQHAPPNDRHADARMAAARDILSPYTTPAQKADIADKWGVTHVLINQDLPPGLVLKYWTLDPDLARRAVATYNGLDGAFEPVASSGGMVLFRRTDETPPRRGVSTPVVAAVPPDAHRIGERAGRATLVAARVEPRAVAPGDDVRIDLYWTRDEPARPGNYVVSLRLDYAGLDLPFGGEPAPKILRKIKERVEGVYYRYRDDHIFQRGFFGPDSWPAGAIVRDPFVVRIPGGLAPGTWTLRARLMRVPPIPNTDLRSYFRDEDMYSGVVIGRVEIAAP